MKHLGSFCCTALGLSVCVSLSAHAQTTVPPPEGVAPREAPSPDEAPSPEKAPSPAEPAAATPLPAPAADRALEAKAPPPEPARPNTAKPAETRQAPGGASRDSASQSTSAPVAVVAAATPEDTDASQGFTGELGTHQDHFLAWVGVRNDYVRDATYDLFAANDALTVFSVGAGRTVWVSGALSVAALGFWEIGGRSAEVRGNDTSLRVQRLRLAPEVRYHFHYRVYGFGRLGLGAEHVHATLENALFAGDLVSNSWAFASDLSAGAALEALGPANGEQRKPRMWIVAEGGYSLVSGTTLSFEAESGGPERSQSEEMGELYLSAPFFRLAVVGTY